MSAHIRFSFVSFFPFLALLLGLCFIGSAAYAQGKGRAVGKKDLRQLAGMMAGEFSSEQQAQADTAFFHIVLRMKPIWKERKDGFWFYVEQATASTPDRPYRQRVYHLYLHSADQIASKVYEIGQPERYAGAWQDAAKLVLLHPDSLTDRQGCAIYLSKKQKALFEGATPGKECLSVLRGAAYATSEVVIDPEKMVSWDRGWNKDDEQVWGAVKGGYIFRKIRPLR